MLLLLKDTLSGNLNDLTLKNKSNENILFWKNLQTLIHFLKLYLNSNSLKEFK